MLKVSRAELHLCMVRGTDMYVKFEGTGICTRRGRADMYIIGGEEAGGGMTGNADAFRGKRGLTQILTY